MEGYVPFCRNVEWKSGVFFKAPYKQLQESVHVFRLHQHSSVVCERQSIPPSAAPGVFSTVEFSEYE